MSDVNRNMPEPALIQSLQWVEIPAGEFLYGEEKERISLPEFSIMKHPVTIRQYRLFCEATGREMPDAPDWGWIDDHPMVNVSWHDASAFAEWVGGALPMEQQWEKAARGTDGRVYPWGDEFDESKCVCDTGKESIFTASVGSFPSGASPYGCMDMEGNVQEWCVDWYDSSNQERVLRGDSWFGESINHFRVWDRKGQDPDMLTNLMGFRVVLKRTAFPLNPEGVKHE